MGDAYQRRAQMYLAWMPLWTKEGALFMSQKVVSFIRRNSINSRMLAEENPQS